MPKKKKDKEWKKLVAELNDLANAYDIELLGGRIRMRKTAFKLDRKRLKNLHNKYIV